MRNKLSETQIQDIAENYLNVMMHMGEFETDLVGTLEKIKQTIRTMEAPEVLVEMLARFRKANGMNPYKYKEEIK
jgi:hypothetical protein